MSESFRRKFWAGFGRKFEFLLLGRAFLSPATTFLGPSGAFWSRGFLGSFELPGFRASQGLRGLEAVEATH